MPEDAAVACAVPGCPKLAYYPHDECYRHRIMSVGVNLKAPAVAGDWHRTANDWKRENLGTDSDRELAKRGIERA